MIIGAASAAFAATSAASSRAGRTTPTFNTATTRAHTERTDPAGRLSTRRRFQSASCVGTVLPVSHKQCIDLPWTDPNFLLGNFTPEQADFLFDWEQGKTIYKQLSAKPRSTELWSDCPRARRRRSRRYGSAGQYQRYARRNHSCRQCVGIKQPAASRPGTRCTKEVFGEIQIPLAQGSAVLKGSFLLAARRASLMSTNVRASDGLTDKRQWQFDLQARRELGGQRLAPFPRNLWHVVPLPPLFEEFKADETSFPSARTIDPCVQLAFNLAQGNISQRIADNCASQGIPTQLWRRPRSRATSHSPGRHRTTRSGNVESEDGQRHPDATASLSCRRRA